MEVRSLIKEACARANIVPRRQAVPGDIQETAYMLLKGIVNKYNANDFLVWTQKSVIIPKSNLIHVYDEDDTLKGDNNMYFASVEDLNAYTPTEEDYENSVLAMVYGNEQTVYSIVNPVRDVYVWSGHTIAAPETQRIQQMKLYMNCLHFKVQNVAKINSLYVISNANEPYREHFLLEYVNHTEFDRYVNTSRVYTYTQKAEGEWLIELKPLFYNGNYRLKMNYNEAMEFDIDSDLFIPENYIELLIVALAHKLALQYPRLDDAQMARLEKEVQVMVDNVRTPKAEDRILTRNNYWDSYSRLTQADLMSGRYIF